MLMILYCYSCFNFSWLFPSLFQLVTHLWKRILSSCLTALISTLLDASQNTKAKFIKVIWKMATLPIADVCFYVPGVENSMLKTIKVRVYAVPFEYKWINHSSHYNQLSVISLLVSYSCSHTFNLYLKAMLNLVTRHSFSTIRCWS